MPNTQSTNFLLELGVEEIPAGYFDSVLQQLQLLDEHTGGNGIVFSTPRRIGYFAESVLMKRPDTEETLFGPPLKMAKNPDGTWSNAALGFAKKVHTSPEQLLPREKEPGSGTMYLSYTVQHTGALLKDHLAAVLPDIIRKLSFPKSMRWIPFDRFAFARPLRWIVALLGSDIIPFEVSGIKASNVTRGHRFLSSGTIAIHTADYTEYAALLKKNAVIIDRAARQQIIRDGVKAVLQKHRARTHDVNEDLVALVADLVEYPVCVTGSFNARFLAVPEEVLITCMEKHQKYFPVNDHTGKLVNTFVTFSNGVNTPAVVKGNERVLAARLADAEFFYTEDQKQPLDYYYEKLKSVVYQEKLGSYYDKSVRVMYLGRVIARLLSLQPATTKQIERAALLCKADLTTHMVGEFPTLQGVMGKYYTQLNGEDSAVSEAICEHYLPRSATDILPQTQQGAILAIADKMDTLAGCFYAGLIPTGSNDPYGLRRHVLGVIKIIRSLSLSIDVALVLKGSILLCMHPQDAPLSEEDIESNKDIPMPLFDALVSFIKDRFYGLLIDEGFRYDILDAVFAAGFLDVMPFLKRLSAVDGLKQSELFQLTAKVVERTANILKKQIITQKQIDPALLQESHEKILFTLLTQIQKPFQDALIRQDYAAASELYANTFAEPLHVFFDKVLVMAPDQAIRENRLLLLKKINDLYTHSIADLSKIVTPGNNG